jgi:glycosyltransferase involved in cell wall biosynthesis
MTPAGERASQDRAFDYTFTVFTPTYNRASTLHRVYESLVAQTYRDFEWVICDDGSTDETGRLVERWMQQADFPIRYVWQENQGYNAAISHGVRLARGAMFTKIDSDDACVPHALECLKHHWDSIPEAERARFTGVTALCVDPRGRVVGDRFPRDPTDSDSLEMRYRFGVNRGSRWGCHRTSILKAFPFPVAEEKFYPSSVVWTAIARRYKTRYVNDALLIYHVGERPDQLTTRGRGAKHPKGHRMWHRCVLNEHIDWFRFAPLDFVRSAANYSRFSLHARCGLGETLRELDAPWPRLLGVLAFPLGVAVYLRDRARART